MHSLYSEITNLHPLPYGNCHPKVKQDRSAPILLEIPIFKGDFSPFMTHKDVHSSELLFIKIWNFVFFLTRMLTDMRLFFIQRDQNAKESHGIDFYPFVAAEQHFWPKESQITNTFS